MVSKNMLFLWISKPVVSKITLRVDRANFGPSLTSAELQ
jgi:hypothetical protein